MPVTLKMHVWFYVNHLSFSFTMCNKLSPKNYLVIHMAHQSNANPCTVTRSPLFWASLFHTQKCFVIILKQQQKTKKPHLAP